ncbi:signal peptide peptidase SppA [Rhizobium sp. KVB221]|uniref:Signal peptide peptidase SppA n=1 Tax=Rhizobium setariae TaxID=2801340 RepID=A0A936YSW5_9HYPH|nr:signal peptide peptidase SppA [Rhizobium setariae]MBL0371820.1 signal peptide peptidase SppA [Rhizobium setariae]
MSVNDIAERRRIRRKLTFWRIFSFLFIAAAIVLLWMLANGGSLSDPTDRDHIARVTISGTIQDNGELIERLDKIARKDTVKALIVSISSPGGTTYGGEQLYKAIRKVSAKKPVVSDVRTLAASAGYMVAIAGDQIVAGDTSITGSIGVIFQYPQIQSLLDKIGVSLEEIKSTPLKAEPSPFHNASEEAKSVMRATVMDTYDWFVDLVAERRGLSKTEALKVADGRVFTGRQAVKEKLVDKIGGMDEIRAFLTTRKIDSNLPIVDWAPPKAGSSYLLGGLAHQILQWTGFTWLDGANTLGKLGEDKMLLDGLVSVWQFER